MRWLYCFDVDAMINKESDYVIEKAIRPENSGFEKI